MILKVSENTVTIRDENNIIYTINTTEDDLNVGEHIIIEYEGTLNKNQEKQTIQITSLQ